MAWLVKTVGKIIFLFLFRVELIGRENIPKEGSAIVCSNHIGTIDMFFIGCYLKRLVHYMAKEELFRNPIVSYIISGAGAFPVKRGKGDIDAIKKAIKLLKEGHLLGIFPEGTRVKGKSAEETKAKAGVVLLAIKTGAPIVPVVVADDYKLFSKVKVIYGKPFYLDIDKNKKYSTDEMEEISRDIMKKVYSLREVS